MLVVLGVRRSQEDGIDERHLGKRPGGGVAEVLLDRNGSLRMLLHVAEFECERDLGVVDLPGDGRVRLIEEVEDGPLREAAGTGEVVANVSE